MPTIQNITGSIVFASGYLTRFNANFGFNSSPTTVNFDLVPGVSGSSEDIANGARPEIPETAIRPGTFHRISVASFDFAGIVKTWNESYGPQGRIYNIELVDPRVVFDRIPVMFDNINVTTGLANSLMNGLHYYGNPESADLNSAGVNFHKVRNFISTGVVSILGRPFTFRFASGFSHTGRIPNWYRLGSTNGTLGSYLQQCGADMGFDYHAHIIPSTINDATGIIYIDMIDRNTAGGSMTAVDSVISNYQSQEILMNYKRGQELRQEPNDCLVFGDKIKEWYQPLTSAGKNTKTYWGRAPDGSALFHISAPSPTNAIETALQSEYETDPDDRNNEGYGMVRLDHIVGSFAEAILQYTKISYESIQVQKSASSSTYPPSLTRTVQINEVTGYYPTQNMMRAALVNEESWAAMVCKETPIWAQVILGYFADKIYLSATSSVTAMYVPFLRAVDFDNVPEADKKDTRLHVINRSDYLSSSGSQLLLNQSIYEATRRAAENYYGKSWICDLPTSNWLSAGTYTSAGSYPEIEYSVASHCWTDKNGQSTPSGIGSHVTLSDTLNPNFRNEMGEVQAFLAIESPNSNTFVFHQNGAAVQDWNLPIDRSFFTNNSVLMDGGGDMCLPLSVEQYQLAPDRAIVTLNDPVTAILPYNGPYPPEDVVPEYISFSNDDLSFGHFLLEMGYTFETIIDYQLLNRFDEKSLFGIAPPRLVNVPGQSNQHGIYIPIQYNYKYHGPFIYTTGNSAGVNIIYDQSLTPSNYGSFASFYSAGQYLALKGSTLDQIINYAEFTVAGYPAYNIGSQIGNSNITSMSMDYGAQGITTSYSLKSFILPKITLGKVLLDRNNGIFLKPLSSEQLITINDDGQQINTVGDFGIINKLSKRRLFGNSNVLYTQFNA